MARPIQGAREALREKIAARKATQKAASSKWARLRQVAAEEAKDVDSALVEVADALGTMADAMSNLREHLDLIEAPKTASLKVRIAAAHKYASTFKRLAEESPEIVADALSEVYHSLDDVAGAVENLAEHMGVELNLSPAEEAFGEEGKEEIAEGGDEHEEPKVDEAKFEEAEKEITPEAEAEVDEAEKEVEGEVEKEAAGADWFTTDRDEEAKPKAPVIAAKKDLKPGEFMDGDKKRKRCRSCGATLNEKTGKCPVDAKTCGRNNKDAGATEWTTDRDEEGEPKVPVTAADKKAAVPGGLFAEDKKWEAVPPQRPGYYEDNPPDDWEECGQCECYHPAGYTGDCRSDINRWPSEECIAAMEGGQSSEQPSGVVASKLAKVDWKARLQDNYDGDFEQFQAYDDIYAIAKRLGFPDAESAWQANPEIGGSTDPNDLQVIDPELDDPDQWEEAESYTGHTRRTSPVMASGEFFITDRDENGIPEAPEKLEIPEAQGSTEVGKAASSREQMRQRVAKRQV
jgi:hypothetical protein